jgi:hypothetical protein
MWAYCFQISASIDSQALDKIDMIAYTVFVGYPTREHANADISKI